jgi:hypothetical protein
MLTRVGMPATTGTPTTAELPETLETLLLQYILRLKTTPDVTSRDKTSQTNMSNARGGQANIFLKSANCKSANSQILKTGSINSGTDVVVLQKFK